MFPPSYQSTIAPGISHHFDNILQYHGHAKFSVKHFKFRSSNFYTCTRICDREARSLSLARKLDIARTFYRGVVGAVLPSGATPTPHTTGMANAHILLSNQKTREGRVCNGIKYIIF
jgi:hypothetical protein